MPEEHHPPPDVSRAFVEHKLLLWASIQKSLVRDIAFTVAMMPQCFVAQPRARGFNSGAATTATSKGFVGRRKACYWLDIIFVMLDI